MTGRNHTIRILVALVMMGAVSACSMMESSKHADNGLPDKWWSDNYYAVLGQNQPVTAAGVSTVKPIKLY